MVAEALGLAGQLLGAGMLVMITAAIAAGVRDDRRGRR